MGEIYAIYRNSQVQRRLGNGALERGREGEGTWKGESMVFESGKVRTCFLLFNSFLLLLFLSKDTFMSFSLSLHSCSFHFFIGVILFFLAILSLFSFFFLSHIFSFLVWDKRGSRVFSSTIYICIIVVEDLLFVFLHLSFFVLKSKLETFFFLDFKLGLCAPLQAICVSTIL